MRFENCDLIVAFDTEYVTEHASAQEGEVLAFDPDVLIRKGNRVLCISFAIFHPASGTRFSGVVELPLSRKRRWTLKQFIEQVLMAVMERGLLPAERLRMADDRLPKRKRNNLRLVLCGHFTRADLPGFADFNKLKRKFSAVRKTYVTIKTPYVLTVRPGRHRAVVSMTLRDTRLLAPEGYGSLAALGDMLGRPKLTTPDVIDESGATVPGITRMDLVQQRHPQAFRTYAVRDSEVALEYLLKVYELAREMGANDVPSTIGALGVWVFKEGTSNFAGFMGYIPDPTSKKGRRLVMHPVLETHRGIWANAYRGGRNQAFCHGVFTATGGRVWNDIDVASAYTVAMVIIPPIDWDSVSMPTRLEDVATVEAATVAQIRFRFPDHTRFPCLPVPAGAGLIFPLSGETTTTGTEILAALNMGAKIEIITAMRFEYASGPHEYAEFTRKITAFRSRFKKINPLFEKLVKAAGNSVYGKVSQAVAGMRSHDPDRTRLFDTITGQRQELPPSSVTNPVHAAMITATIRAVLGEILSNLPSELKVLSVTTDGFLTNATLEEALAATCGPIASWFKKALHAVAPGKSLLEVKHQASTVIVARTRGAFSVEAPEGYTGSPILARAGHKLEDFTGDAWAEAKEFVRIFLEREPNTILKGRDFISVEDQWQADADLVSIPADKRLNLDYDMGGVPVEVGENRGVLFFRTVPWPHRTGYEAARKAHADLRAADGHMKTLADWHKIEAKVRAVARLEPTGGVEDIGPWLRAAVALELSGSDKPMSLGEGAAALTELGLPTTTSQLANAGKKARQRGLPNAPSTRLLQRLLVPNRVSDHGSTVQELIKNHILQAKSCPNYDGSVLYMGVGEQARFGTIQKGAAGEVLAGQRSAGDVPDGVVGKGFCTPVEKALARPPPSVAEAPSEPTTPTGCRGSSTLLVRPTTAKGKIIVGRLR